MPTRPWPRWRPANGAAPDPYFEARLPAPRDVFGHRQELRREFPALRCRRGVRSHRNPGTLLRMGDVIVLGAGAAGLAVAAQLKARGADCVVVERGPGVATSWRGRYDRLRLHTIR